MTISAVLSVFNEEARIDATLRSFAWCDEIVILDKTSTDRTLEIARKYTSKILTVPWREFRPDEFRLELERVSSEWVFKITASNLIHPELAAQIRELTQRVDFPYDVIHVPFRRFVLGLETKRSPWHSELFPLVYRRRVARVNEKSVHGALTFDTKRHYRLPRSSDYCMYHLTHPTADEMMERHIRYWRAEARTSSGKTSLRKAFADVMRSIFTVFCRRKTWLMGWDGIALSFAYLSYSMMRFVYIWEKRRSRALQTYQGIRESILQEWDESEKKKHV